MLKIGKVYSHGKSLVFIADKFKRKKSITYIGQKVYQNGTLGSRYKLKEKRGQFKLQKDIKVEIRITLPREQQELVRYLSVVDRALGHLELLEAMNWRSKGLKMKIAEIAWASCYYYNHDQGRYYDLRDFAKQLGFTRYSRIYPWVADFLESLFTNIKYEKQVPDCADTTLVSQVREYSKRWKSYHGFSKRIDKLIDIDFKAYTFEISKRGLQPYV